MTHGTNRVWRKGFKWIRLTAATTISFLVAVAVVREACARSGRWTVADRVAQYGGQARARLVPHCAAANVAYPPTRVTFIGLKHEKRLEVWATDTDGIWRHVRDYPILAASGKLGPKLREGDGQVPEGLYKIESLNPNSRYHLSLRVNYPNADDRARGKADGRQQLGGDIMIHGKAASAGCLAMGDEAAEDLFVLAAEVGISKMDVILSPVDFRVRPLPEPVPPLPAWIGERYVAIRQALVRFRHETTASPNAEK